jgi:site-specific recombinase XerD
LAQIDYYLKALRSERKSPNTIYIYKHTLYRFAKFINHDDVTPSDVRDYIISLMDAGLKPHSVHVHYRNLKTFFNWLVVDGVLTDNPMKNIRPPKLPKLVIKPFTRQDIDNILLICSGPQFINIRNMAIVLILLDTGIRLLELANLKLSDINNSGDILTVYGKGSKERRVPLGLRAQRALNKYLMLRGDEGSALWLTESRTI